MHQVLVVLMEYEDRNLRQTQALAGRDMRHAVTLARRSTPPQLLFRSFATWSTRPTAVLIQHCSGDTALGVVLRPSHSSRWIITPVTLACMRHRVDSTRTDT